jgi:nucleoid-associated protein YgaU
MPKEAKLGLSFGVGLVIALGVVFFRRDAPAGVAGATGNVKLTPTSSAPPAVGPEQHTGAAPAVPGPGLVPLPVPGGNGQSRAHTVQEGETLCSLAVRYYGSADKSTALFRFNQDRMRSPDRLRPGTVLLIPDLAEGK